ncbi:AP-3 complex subunit mu-like [Ziziphus jujuba]|uniref:AP-3 complex subunit mu-like n=1 Tax=Ziziphus jujuba TaxID=326968 RepID=A0ABM3ISC5_ZIZJJ|nr:AP-3 complex subunit mu-like [Ziziphus jujuba]
MSNSFYCFCWFLIELQPVIASPTHFIFFQILRQGIAFLACTQVEMTPVMAIEFLSRVADVLSDYLRRLNEDLIKDTFMRLFKSCCKIARKSYDKLRQYLSCIFVGLSKQWIVYCRPISVT